MSGRWQFWRWKRLFTCAWITDSFFTKHFLYFNHNECSIFFHISKCKKSPLFFFFFFIPLSSQWRAHDCDKGSFTSNPTHDSYKSWTQDSYRRFAHIVVQISYSVLKFKKRKKEIHYFSPSAHTPPTVLRLELGLNLLRSLNPASRSQPNPVLQIWCHLKKKKKFPLFFIFFIHIMFSSQNAWTYCLKKKKKPKKTKLTNFCLAKASKIFALIIHTWHTLLIPVICKQHILYYIYLLTLPIFLFFFPNEFFPVTLPKKTKNAFWRIYFFN